MSSKARNLSDFISNPAIDSTELGSGSVTTDKLSDQAVTPAKLHNTLDLSSKTVTLANDGISGNSVHGGVISSFASTGIDDNASATAITITSGGNVGIGTGSPGAKLDVRGSSIFLVNATNPTAWVSVDSALTTGSMYNQWNTTSNVGISGTYTNHAYTFVTNNNERMRITSAGNVGINNTNPQYKLDVTGNPGAINIGSTVEPGLRISNTGSSGLIWDIFSGGGGASDYNNWLTVYRRDTNPNASHGLWVSHGYLRLTDTTEHSAAPAGSMYYDTAEGGAIRLKNESQWVTVGGAIGSSGNPATDMSQVPVDGFYYFTDGINNWQAYVKKDWHLSRNWMLVLKTFNRGDIPSGSSYWTNNILYNETDSNISGGSWAKYGSWNHQPFNYVLMDMNGTVPAIMQFNTTYKMYNAMQNNAGAEFGGLACNSTSPSFGQVSYNGSGFYYSGGPFSAQAGTETVVQMYGINSFGNNAANGNPDNAGLASVGRSGARVGCPLDEGSHSFNAATNAGSDSGFGFGYCGGNEARTGSCGYAEWSSAAVVEISPGRLWVS